MRPIRRALLAALCCSTIASGAFAADLAQDCHRLAAHPEHPLYPLDGDIPVIWMQDMDTGAAIPACQAALELDPGNPRLLFQLGRAYDVAGRPSDANAYYRRAIDLGDPVAMVNLALHVQQGQGTEASDAGYLELAKRAEATGYPRGIGAVGEAYWNGWGVDQDDATAVTYFLRSAEAGYSIGMSYLGAAFRDGRGVDVDAEESLRWYQAAADAGDVNALVQIGDLYYYGEIVGEDMVLSAAYFRQAAVRGDPSGMANLGWMYESGQGVEETNEQAKYWYRHASDHGVIWARDNLAYLLYLEDDFERNAEAVILWRDIAESDSDRAASALYNIGWAYREGYA